MAATQPEHPRRERTVPSLTNLRSGADAAKHFAVNPATISGWHSKNYITAYRLPGHRGMLFDLAEIERELIRRPSQMRDGRRRRGRVITLAPAPVSSAGAR